MVNYDKIFSSESEDKKEEGTEVGVYACSQGVFDTNSKPLEIGGYQIDATKTDSSEQSEEAISDFLFQHGKKIHSDEELIEILNKLKEKHKNKLVKNYSEFKKLGGISGLNLMGILKSIGPNGAEFREMENILLFETRPNGSFVWKNIFCFIKTGNDRKKGKTMKCVSVACMMPSKK